MALGNVLDPEAIPDLFAQFNQKQHNCYNKCKEYLTEGVMSEEFVTENLGSLMSCVRDSNVSLRWLMLHRKTQNEKLKEYLAPSNEVALLNLLLICSEFENVLREIVASLLEKKQTLWNQDKDTCAEKLKELSDYYGKAITLGKIEADDSLK